jgi:polyphosphate glucokinase
MLLSPRLFIVGGGVSKKADKWLPLIEIRTPIVAATLLNNAGIIGAAVTAEQAHGHPGAFPVDADQPS